MHVFLTVEYVVNLQLKLKTNKFIGTGIRIGTQVARVYRIISERPNIELPLLYYFNKYQCEMNFILRQSEHLHCSTACGGKRDPKAVTPTATGWTATETTGSIGR